jgi:hypothetical protein
LPAPPFVQSAPIATDRQTAVLTMHDFVDNQTVAQTSPIVLNTDGKPSIRVA